jgi:hypothetical protein
MVHKTLQMGCLCAAEDTLSDSKQMRQGVYEQGRKISKPPPVEFFGLSYRTNFAMVPERIRISIRKGWFAFGEPETSRAIFLAG